MSCSWPFPSTQAFPWALGQGPYAPTSLGPLSHPMFCPAHYLRRQPSHPGTGPTVGKNNMTDCKGWILVSQTEFFCIYECMYLCVWIFLCVGQRTPQKALHHVFWDRVSPWLWPCWFNQAGWPVRPQRFTCHCLQGWQVLIPMPGSLAWPRGLSLGSQACSSHTISPAQKFLKWFPCHSVWSV